MIIEDLRDSRKMKKKIKKNLTDPRYNFLFRDINTRDFSLNYTNELNEKTIAGLSKE